MSKQALSKQYFDSAMARLEAIRKDYDFILNGGNDELATKSQEIEAYLKSLKKC